MTVGAEGETDPRPGNVDGDPIQKQPVETLDLRVRPRRVVRFKRRAIIALCAASSVAFVTVGWVALKPVTFRSVATGEDRDVETKSSFDALGKAPATYTDVPKLGPPLPGDLGPAILAHQQATGMATPTSGTIAQDGQTIAAEAQRVAAERLAARQAGVMMQLKGAGASESASTGQQPVAPVAETSGEEASATLGPRMDVAGANPHRLVGAQSRFVISAGSIIAANLITGLNSDVPGLVTAQVSQAAYDSPTGRVLLIPQGARLVGRYEDKIAYGQRRASVIWQRIIFPDGASLQIDDVPAADSQGHSGLADRVDGHGWQLVKGALLSSVLGIGTELSVQGEGHLTRALRQSLQQNMASAGDKLVGKSLDIQPTITVRPGWPLRIVVQKDLILSPWSNTGERE